jgi:hypothetical protein
LPATPTPWEIVELGGALDDWTSAHFVIRAPGAPGGLAVIMGGLGEVEERANANLINTAADLLAACKAQHDAIDILFARLISIDREFLPSKSGKPWDALLAGVKAINKASGGGQ